ncbi:MAG TPA: hypothetical protein VKR43_03935 [Bryobacteraceae bacterium]|nr:hypothetical protein [Bryobacteraceae bacterium]
MGVALGGVHTSAFTPWSGCDGNGGCGSGLRRAATADCRALQGLDRAIQSIAFRDQESHYLFGLHHR